MPPLTAEQCPLVRDPSLISRTNAATQRLQELGDRLKSVREFDAPLAQARELLGAIANDLRRTHYRVGFLGTTQAGKSTTFNNLLRVSEDEAPAKSGGGPATTAAPSRLRRSEDGQHRIALRYMLEAEYQHRRDALVEYLELGKQLTEDELLREVERLRERLMRGEVMRCQLGDLRSLQALILSRRAYSGYVVEGPQRHEEKGDYAKRYEYLNHAIPDPNAPQPPTPAPSKYRLLWEALIHLNNQVLPPNLEMMDLPGLGAGQHHDTCVTLDIVNHTGGEQLHGALIFLNAGRLENRDVLDLIHALQKSFGTALFGRRVWLIVTQMDALTDAHYRDGSTWFPGLSAFWNQTKIPPENTFLICNRIKDPPAEMSQKDRIERAGIVLDRPADSADLKARLAEYPAFQPLFEALYLSGGRDRLREALKSRLADDISSEVAEQVARRLGQVESSLELVQRMADRRQSQSREDRDHATRCAQTINRVLHDGDRRGFPELQAAIGTITRKLHEQVKNVSPVENLATIAPAAIRRTFEQIGRRLDEEVFNALTTDAALPVYERIANTLQGLPAVPLAQAESVQAAWRAFLMDDTEPKGWEGHLPQFHQPGLIQEITSMSDAIRGGEFESLVTQKIEIVTLEMVHLLKRRVVDRLRSLSEQLDMLADHPRT